ncbi:cell division protein SepF [Marinicrinis lubricantis]|uniref:Cell division protein SepF n=1 Tax=Marinicrinis lubricantis TaxID=2086470 RepID=A0ABW1ISA2_9BACL
MGVMNKVMNFLGLQEEEEIVERERVVETDDEMEPAASDFRKSNKANVVSIHSQKSTKVMLCEPNNYDEAQEIADYLRSRRSVVVNLQRVRRDQAVRIVDFLSGTVYALNGNISKIGPHIFMCAPETVEIHGKITGMLNEEAE